MSWAPQVLMATVLPRSKREGTTVGKVAILNNYSQNTLYCKFNQTYDQWIYY